MTIGARIKAARKQAGMTQAELALKLGIPYQSIGQWERDIRNPKVETLQRIATALNVSLVDIAGSTAELDPVIWEKLLSIKQHIEVGKTAESDLERREAMMKAQIEFGEVAPYIQAWSSVRNEERSQKERELLDAFESLNYRGQCVAVERIKELAQIHEYQLQQVPGDD